MDFNYDYWNTFEFEAEYERLGGRDSRRSFHTRVAEKQLEDIRRQISATKPRSQFERQVDREFTRLGIQRLSLDKCFDHVLHYCYCAHEPGRRQTLPWDPDLSAWANARKNVRDRWIIQGIWADELGDLEDMKSGNLTKFTDLWAHEVEETPNDDADGLDNNSGSSGKKQAVRKRLTVRNRLASQPLYQFKAQIRHEFEWVKDDHYCYYPLKPISFAELLDEARASVRGHWAKDDIWIQEWNMWPGKQWRHELHKSQAITEDDVSFELGAAWWASRKGEWPTHNPPCNSGPVEVTAPPSQQDGQIGQANTEVQPTAEATRHQIHAECSEAGSSREISANPGPCETEPRYQEISVGQSVSMAGHGGGDDGEHHEDNSGDQPIINLSTETSSDKSPHRADAIREDNTDPEEEEDPADGAHASTSTKAKSQRRRARGRKGKAPAIAEATLGDSPAGSSDAKRKAVTRARKGEAVAQGASTELSAEKANSPAPKGGAKRKPAGPDRKVKLSASPPGPAVEVSSEDAKASTSGSDRKRKHEASTAAAASPNANEPSSSRAAKRQATDDAPRTRNMAKLARRA